MLIRAQERGQRANPYRERGDDRGEVATKMCATIGRGFRRGSSPRSRRESKADSRSEIALTRET